MFDTLISVADLETHLDDTDWLIFDCRHDLADPEAGRKAFDIGRISGSQHLHLDHDLSGSLNEWRTSPGGRRSNGGRHPLPNPDILRERLQELGVSDQTQIVAVDAQGGMFAARLWWLARWLGHEKVAVLDGGLQAWEAANFALRRGPAPRRSPGELKARPSLVDRASIDTVFDNLTTQALTVVDARAPDRFRGENETIDLIGGHIPGAVNRFFKDNLRPDGTFKSAKALRADWLPLVGDDASTAVMQCGSGVTACHNLLALEVAGLSGAALYPGSWSDWISDGSRPIVR